MAKIEWTQRDYSESGKVGELVLFTVGYQSQGRHYVRTWLPGFKARHQPSVERGGEGPMREDARSLLGADRRRVAKMSTNQKTELRQRIRAAIHGAEPAHVACYGACLEQAAAVMDVLTERGLV